MNRTHSRQSLTARALAAVWLILATFGCGAPDALRFTVLFEDAAGLEAGMPVEYRGLEIGKVTAVGLDDQGLVEVAVVVENEYRSAITHSSTIRSETRGIRRRPHLIVTEGEPQGERRAVQDGDVLKGSPRMLDDALTRLQDGARAAWQSTTEAASDLQEKLSEAARESQEEFRRPAARKRS